MSFLQGKGFVQSGGVSGDGSGITDPAAFREKLLDQDGSYPVDSITLGSSGGVELPDGSLSRNTEGNLVVHNNNNTGDNLNPILDARSALRFAATVVAASMSGAGTGNNPYFTKVGQILLPADWATIGEVLDIQAKIRAGWSAGNKPDAGAYLVFCSEGMTPTVSSGVMVAVATGTTSESRDMWLKFNLTAASSNWKIGNGMPATIKMSLVIKEASGTTTVDDEGVDETDVFFNISGDAATGVSGEPHVLSVYVATIDDSDTVAANLYISGLISISKE